MSEKFVFETAMKRIEEIVRLLERGDAPLDQSLALFEEGTGLIKKCSAALDHAEQKVTLLMKTPDGPAETAFDEKEETAE
ncbi:exodeoxyribonuclease VII small subunit [Acidaminobacterium chupaoyuni]